MTDEDLVRKLLANVDGRLPRDRAERIVALVSDLAGQEDFGEIMRLSAR
jgi:hypothetical protein